MEGDWTWGGGNTKQYRDDMLQNCIPETDITNITPINSIQILKNKMKNITNKLHQ